MGQRENVEINNSSQVNSNSSQCLNLGPQDIKSNTLPNELKRYPTSIVLVAVLVNSNGFCQTRTWIGMQVTMCIFIGINNM